MDCLGEIKKCEECTDSCTKFDQLLEHGYGNCWNLGICIGARKAIYGKRKTIKEIIYECINYDRSGPCGGSDPWGGVQA